MSCSVLQPIVPFCPAQDPSCIQEAASQSTNYWRWLLLPARGSLSLLRGIGWGVYFMLKALSIIILRSLSILLSPILFPVRLLIVKPTNLLFSFVLTLRPLWYFLVSAVALGAIAALAAYAVTDLFAIRLALREQRKRNGIKLSDDYDPSPQFSSSFLDMPDATSILKPALRRSRASDTFDDEDTDVEKSTRALNNTFLKPNQPSPPTLRFHRSNSLSSGASADEGDDTGFSDSSVRSGSGKRVTWALDEPISDRKDSARDRSASPVSSSGSSSGKKRLAASSTRRRKR